MRQVENKHGTADVTPTTLGNVVRRTREQSKVSVRGLAKLAGVDPSYISRVEDSSLKQPSPEKLLRIAECLELDYNDLYALAGYQAPGLPNFLPYLRAKYDITDEDARNLSDHFERLRQQHGITERTVQAKRDDTQLAAP